MFKHKPSKNSRNNGNNGNNGNSRNNGNNGNNGNSGNNRNNRNNRNNYKKFDNNENFSNILRYFPKIELPYEKSIHNKVQADIYVLIPKGKKCFLWFKNHNNKPFCFMMVINLKNKKITSITSKITSFDPILCSGTGTILYGTSFEIKENKCFCIENIYYNKGHNLCKYNQYEKLKHINELMHYNISQHRIINNQLTIGTPAMSPDIEKIYQKALDIPYQIYSIQHRLLFQNKTFLNLIYKNKQTLHKIFNIKATIINDIYDLYDLDNNPEVKKTGVAYIPDYKTSVFMNRIFRNIKENENLDALEESDDEEEFEDTSIDKFVDLDKFEKLKCVYNNKFNGWVPIAHLEN